MGAIDDSDARPKYCQAQVKVQSSLHPLVQQHYDLSRHSISFHDTPNLRISEELLQQPMHVFHSATSICHYCIQINLDCIFSLSNTNCLSTGLLQKENKVAKYSLLYQQMFILLRTSSQQLCFAQLKCKTQIKPRLQRKCNSRGLYVYLTSLCNCTNFAKHHFT